ncbi:MAG: M48 family peptidase [Oscillospiraceae bacterium]|jgi:predicted metal-dependent hydrolase
MSYTLRIQKSNRKTISLSITREGEVLVKVPLFLEDEAINAFVQKHRAWIEKHLTLLKERNKQEKTLMLTPEKVAVLKERAKIYLNDRVQYYSKMMNLHPTGVKITSAKTRWGSCSPKNSLCFSYRLMLLDPDAIDYVVVHELAHIREKNHGPGFYREVAKYLPDYKQRIALLKECQRKIGL